MSWPYWTKQPKRLGDRSKNTVDGWNPAPVDMDWYGKYPNFWSWFYTFQVVPAFSSINSMNKLGAVGNIKSLWKLLESGDFRPPDPCQSSAEEAPSTSCDRRWQAKHHFPCFRSRQREGGSYFICAKILWSDLVSKVSLFVGPNSDVFCFFLRFENQRCGHKMEL